MQNLKRGLPLERFDKWYGLEWLGCEAGAGSTPATLSILGRAREQLQSELAEPAELSPVFPPSRHDHVQRQASQPEM